MKTVPRADRADVLGVQRLPRRDVLHHKEDTRSSIISMPEGKVAVISGLKEYIVVDTEDVLMICPRTEEQNIKKYIDEVKYHTGDRFI